jgi:glucose-6-phosphate 1-dehydrogenase
VGCAFAEDAVFRIDHYLGKESVQNLLALRFGNSILAPVWNNQYISNVQITVAETVGVEGRISYYANTGAFKDMVQNHLLQLLCLVAMEPPNSLDANAIRDEKVKVLRALTPFDTKRARADSVRGQYQPGLIDGQPVPGYRDEIADQGDARTETFVALRATIDNWRWAGVPFYLRTGKRLARRFSEIVIEFKPQPFSIFAQESARESCNRLLIRLQPEENTTLWMMHKKPVLSSSMELQPVLLDLMAARQEAKYSSYDAYVRLLLDVINNNQTLFMRRDEIETAWIWADSVIAAWRQLKQEPLPYLAGSMGPDAAINLVARDNAEWFRE